MLYKKNIKRTKRELKYIDIIANILGLIDGFDCGGEFSQNTYGMLKDFKLSNYDMNLIKKIFSKHDYYTYTDNRW